eukprot:tig00020616_g12274.t1
MAEGRSSLPSELDDLSDDILESALDSIGAKIDAERVSTQGAPSPGSPAAPRLSKKRKRGDAENDDERPSALALSSDLSVDALPDEVLQHIFQYIEGPEIASVVARVCSKWRQIAARGSLWRAVYLRRWLRVGYYQIGVRGLGVCVRGLPSGENMSGRWSGCPNLAKGEEAVSRTGDARPAELNTIDDAAWKGLYVERDELDRNWDRGRYRVDFLEGHAGAVCSLQSTESTIVSGGQDAEVRVWDADSGRCVAALRGHKAAVWCVASDGDCTILSASGDKTIKVWDLLGLECVDTLRGHTAEVWSLQFDAQRVASASVDSTVKLWDRATSTCVRTLQGHVSSVFSVQLRGDTVLSGGADSTAKLWDLRVAERGGLVRSLAGHTQQVFTVQYNDNNRPVSGDRSDRRSVSDSFAGAAARYDRALTGSGDATLKLWDLASGRCLRTFAGHRDSVWCARYDGRRIVSGSVDRSVRVWGDAEGRPRASFHVHVEPVFCLDVDEAKIVSGSGDGVIALWDFSRRTEEEQRFDGSSWRSDGAFVEAHRQFAQIQEDQQESFERARHRLADNRRLDRFQLAAKFA